MTTLKIYPIGIQTFSRIIREGYIYVDKTDLMWQMTRLSPFIFLSRPRRFGKSLLSTTLEAYFSGEKDLFKGLKIMQLEKDWKKYPVIRIDLSTGKNKKTAGELCRYLHLVLDEVNKFGNNPKEKTLGERLHGMIRRAYQQTGQQVVVIIDEYDAPILDVLHKEDTLVEVRQVMQEFYEPLKASESMIKFCFITGITKFSQLSIFSTINNLNDVSMLPRFANICGITEQELVTTMSEDINMLAESQGVGREQMHQLLKERYDGYHFSEDSDEVYNPYSLLKCFANQKLAKYWFDSGTPSFLINKMRDFNTNITRVDDLEVPVSAFDKPTEAMTTALPLLYQSGYLTIKDYDHETMIYSLSIPNREVRIGYTEGLLPSYTGVEPEDVQAGFALKFWKCLKEENLNQALHELQVYLESIPYIEGFKKKLQETSNAEGFYEYTLYLIFSMLNVYVNTQVKCRGGRIDVVILMPGTTYILELKTRGTAKEALEQITEKKYAIPFQSRGRKVVRAGLLFDIESRTLKE